MVRSESRQAPSGGRLRDLSRSLSPFCTSWSPSTSINTLGLPVGSLVAPAAVLGAALGFGAQRIVQDLLSGFFIITEKQYGFGDLVQLTITGSVE